MSTAQNNLVPKLIQTDSSDNIEREFAPLVVTRLGGTLPWDTDSTQLDCGQTVTANSGDMSMRLVFHCEAPQSELQTLQEMREAGTQIELVSNFYSGPATFDELKVDRIPNSNGAVVRGTSENYDEPMYEIQLQSKEESEDNDGIDLSG